MALRTSVSRRVRLVQLAHADFDIATNLLAGPDGSRLVIALDEYPFGSILWQCVQSAIGRAGLTRWPRPWHNLRATRQTELQATSQRHVVCDWMGNSAAIAERHYLTTTEADYASALTQIPARHEVKYTIENDQP